MTSTLRQRGIAELGAPLEAAVHSWASAHTNVEEAYVAKAKQLIFNCKKDPTLLYLPVEKLVLVVTDSMVLPPTTVASDIEINKLLDVDLLDQDNIRQSTPMLVCSRCKNTDIAFESKQTRGADEAATIFCVCKNPECEKRWRMS